MNAIKISGRVDEEHRFVADVPCDIPPGPIEALLVMPDDEVTEDEWMRFVAQQWADDLADKRQDIYTLEDGVPVDEAR